MEGEMFAYVLTLIYRLSLQASLAGMRHRGRQDDAGAFLQEKKPS
jgi:hypothetical protein